MGEETADLPQRLIEYEKYDGKRLFSRATPPPPQSPIDSELPDGAAFWKGIMRGNFRGFDHPPPPFGTHQQAPGDQPQQSQPQLAEPFPEFFLSVGPVPTGNLPWDQDNWSRSPHASLTYDEMTVSPELSSYAPPPSSYLHHPFGPANFPPPAQWAPAPTSPRPPPSPGSHHPFAPANFPPPEMWAPPPPEMWAPPPPEVWAPPSPGRHHPFAPADFCSPTVWDELPTYTESRWQATDPPGGPKAALVVADPAVRAEPSLALLDQLPRPASTLVEDPFQLAPAVIDPAKEIMRPSTARHGEAKDNDLLSNSKSLGDPVPSAGVLFHDLQQFYWEIRKVQVTPEHRPPWQDILEQWGPPDLKANSFYNIAVRKINGSITLVNAAIYPELGVMVIKNPKKEPQSFQPLSIAEIYFQCLKSVQQASGASTLAVNQILMVGLDNATTTGYMSEYIRYSTLFSHSRLGAVYVPRVTGLSARPDRRSNWFLCILGSGAVAPITNLLTEHPTEMERRIVEAFYVGGAPGYLLVNLVKVSVSISAGIL